MLGSQLNNVDGSKIVIITRKFQDEEKKISNKASPLFTEENQIFEKVGMVFRK